MSFTVARSLLSSGSRTVTGQGSSVPVPEASSQIAVMVKVTSVSGTTPSMTCTVQWSQDNGATFADADPADAFTPLTVTGNVVKSFPARGEHFRLVWTITGTTPSFTFSATAYGVD
jgi:hypothetical protein